ncbi:MAG: MarR family winged helix-turn-helix transcriptional regulator [Clostridiaceae bacterium]|jgi:DNA-binding MarR family transcriptional regulator|nr:MarR family winged helix-turn-helix transcriptional regulator [Clostridiaceae bacterium]
MKLLELVKRFDMLFFKRRILFQKVASDAGLYVGQLPIIEYIARHDGCSQVEIADTLHLSPASVAISTKRLQRAGIIDKAVDESNLRSKKLTITDKGLEMSKKCRELFDSLDKRLFANFEEEELIQLKGYLDRLIANISDEQGKLAGMSFCEIIALGNQLEKDKCFGREGKDE